MTSFAYNPFTDNLDYKRSMGGSGGIVTITGNTGGAVMSDGAGNFNLVGAGGVTVTGNPGTNTQTISISGAGFTWNVVTSATNPNSLVAENGYIPKGAAVVNFILPATAAIGDEFKIAGYGNLWTLAQNAGQNITLGAQSTTAGVLHAVAATQVRDSITLLCVTANTEFQIIDGIGNISFT